MRKILFATAAFISLMACANFMMAPSNGRYNHRVTPPTSDRPPDSVVHPTREERICQEMMEPINRIRPYLTDPTVNSTTREAIAATIEQYDNKCTRPVEQNQE